MAAPTPTAPKMPAGYGAPTDGSGAELVPWDWAAQQLESARNYWLCTTRADGRAHAAPVWGLWLDAELWFSTDPASQKGRNLARDVRATVHLGSGDDVVILEGEVARTPWSESVIDAYDAKYGFRVEPTSETYGAYVFRSSVAQTWTERDYPKSATRWVFD